MAVEQIVLIVFFAVFFFFYFLFVFGISAAVYLLTAIPLYRLGKRHGVKNPWLAFVPQGIVFVMEPLGGNKPFSLFGGKIYIPLRRQAAWLYLALNIIYLGSALMLFPFFYIPIVNFFAIAIFYLIWIPVCFLLCASFWKFLFDMLCELRPESGNNVAMAFLGTFIAPVTIVLLWQLVNRPVPPALPPAPPSAKSAPAEDAPANTTASAEDGASADASV